MTATARAESAGARTRRLIARATGPSAITWWTWLVTAPFALTVMSGLQYVANGPWAVVAVASLQHAAVGGLLLCGSALLRITSARARPSVVLLIFALIGALRPLLFLASGAALGIPVRAGDLAGRIMINFVVTVTVFALIAVAVDLVRDHLGVYRRLRAARSASARDAEQAAERIGELRGSAVDDVLGQLETATEAAAEHGIQAQDAARLLRALAEEVVRPASHRLYEDEDAQPDAAAGDARVSNRDWVVSVLGGMRAAPPLLLALLYAALVTPFAIQQYGIVVSLLPLLSGLLVVWLANAVLARLVEVTVRRWRLLVLVTGYLLIGVLLSATSDLVVRAMGHDPRLVWFESATYGVIAIGVALVASLSARVRQDQSELEAALQANIQSAARMRADYEHERASLARLLHSGVQAELIAAALALGAARGGRPEEDASAELRAVVQRIRAELLAPPAEPDAADRVAALVESWRSAIPLRTTIGDGVWDRLREPARASAVVDAISEGLANAVRHGDGTPVSLEVRPDRPSGVEVVVTSGGALASAQPGIGLRQLSERGAVTLHESGAGRVELAVAIP